MEVASQPSVFQNANTNSNLQNLMTATGQSNKIVENKENFVNLQSKPFVAETKVVENQMTENYDNIMN